MTTIALTLDDATLDAIADRVAARIAALSAPAAPERPAHVGVSDAARQLGCSVRQVRRLIATRRLEASKLTPSGSSRVLVSQLSIDRVLREGRQ